MPLYEYLCHECGTTAETYRRVDERNMPFECSMGHRMERIYSVPALSIWDSSRRFPNAVAFGSGTFPTKADYESHLKSHDMAETKTDGKIYRPHGSKVVRTYR